jgi:hypothetical protein
MTSEMNRLYSALAYATATVLKKKLILTSTDRTCARQLELSGPTSYHLNGQAFDAQIQPYSRDAQAIVGRSAVQFGYRWGGNFTTYDDVHFDNGNRTSPGSCT